MNFWRKRFRMRTAVCEGPWPQHAIQVCGCRRCLMDFSLADAGCSSGPFGRMMPRASEELFLKPKHPLKELPSLLFHGFSQSNSITIVEKLITCYHTIVAPNLLCFRDFSPLPALLSCTILRGRPPAEAVPPGFATVVDLPSFNVHMSAHI